LHGKGRDDNVLGWCSATTAAVEQAEEAVVRVCCVCAQLAPPALIVSSRPEIGQPGRDWTGQIAAGHFNCEKGKTVVTVTVTGLNVGCLILFLSLIQPFAKSHLFTEAKSMMAPSVLWH